MRLSRRGFTLVELLMVIAILGIITAMSFPLIRKISIAGENKKYTVYRDSLTGGAKLYVDSYSEDLFGHMKSGCAYITYKELSEKSLVKEISVDGITCDTDETYIRVVKVNNMYSYTTYMGCGNKNEGSKVDVVKRFPDNIPEMDEENCGLGKPTVSIKGNPETTKVPEKKELSVKVTLQSITGLLKKPGINYGWSKTKNASAVTNWSQLSFQIPSRKEQEKIIFDENKQLEVTQNVTTPSGETGDYYLVISINQLYDLAGMGYEDEKYIFLGPYRLDNIAPKFRNSKVVSNADGYNSLAPKLELNASDNYTPESGLKMCVSFDKDSCVKTATNIEKYGSYVKDKVLGKVSNTYDGSTHKVYVTVADRAGNYTTKSFDYRVSKKYKLTYNSNGGSACSPTSKEVFENNTWGSLCTSRKSGYVFVGWNTKKDGTGSFIASNTVASANRTVYAVWKPKTYTLTYDSDGGTVCSPATKTSYTGSTWGILCKPTRTNYIFDGWYTAKAGGGSKITEKTDATSDITVYAKWKLEEKTFTATFKYQNGAHLWNNGNDSVKVSCTTTSGSCSVNAPSINNLPGKSGCGNAYSKLFNVKGWSTDSSASTGVSGTITISSNVNYYSIIVPNSTYTASKKFYVKHYTCDGQKNNAIKNVYNRTAAKDKKSFYSDNNYIVEGHSFTWNGTWKVNSSAYNKCSDPSNDKGDCEWLYLVGKGGLCRKGKDVESNNIDSCPDSSYIKASQLEF